MHSANKEVDSIGKKGSSTWYPDNVVKGAEKVLNKSNECISTLSKFTLAREGHDLSNSLQDETWYIGSTQ